LKKESKGAGAISDIRPEEIISQGATGNNCNRFDEQ
jgi:hypothetical protein